MSQSPDLRILISLAAPDKAIRRIREICPKAELRVAPWIEDEGVSLDKKLMRGADVLLCEQPPDNFDVFDTLKWIQLTSAGYSQILDLPVLQRGIRVTNGLGNFDIPIAEWNLMMVLMWHRHMLELLENQKNSVWDRDAKFQVELRGTRLGFYGYGGIARETARLAKHMGLEVWVMTRDGTIKTRENIYRVAGSGDPEGQLPDRVFGPSQMDQFLSQVDYLLLTLPLGPATEGIIGEKELQLLKRTSVLINPARGPLVDLKALVRCLQEKWIRGASFDAHYAYPLPPDHPVWSLPNMILTPHISGSAAGTHFLERIYDIFVQNLQRYCAGEPLLNELSEAQLQGK